MSITQTYTLGDEREDNWWSALAHLRSISFSLEQSIPTASVSPDRLHKIEAENQVYYHASECQTPRR